MINQEFFAKLRGEYRGHEEERRAIIAASNNILHASKRAIFALHRDDVAKAGELLADNEAALKELDASYGHVRLAQEGSYRAACEEYVEAKMFQLVSSGQPVDAIAGLQLDYESYLGGICDLTGEMVRQAINRASAGKPEEVGRIKDSIDAIMAELVEFDMTSYLRTKYDQAKTNLRKIEQISYELRLRQLK
jgi:predicted translin family RNA/ssDNA-binding protein